MRILICEDSEQNLQSAREFAEKYEGEHEVVISENPVRAGYDVSSSGQEVGRSTRGHEVLWIKYGDKIDCVLTDLYMAGCRGDVQPAGLYIALAAIQQGIPACIVTDGNAHGDDRLVSALSGVLQRKNELFQFFLLENVRKPGAKGSTSDGKLIKDWEYCFQSLMQKKV